MAQDEDLPPPKADFSAPPPYELVSSAENQPHSRETHVPITSGNGTGNRPITSQQQHIIDMDQRQTISEVVTPMEQQLPALPSKLPTYEEVQMEKSRLGEMPMDLQNTFPSVHGRIPPPSHPSHPVLISALRNAHAQAAASGGPPGSVAVGPNGTLTFIAIDSGEQGRHHLQHHQSSSAGVVATADGGAVNVDNSLLGTDFMFLAAFIVAFLFNWIGFLMLTCFFHTIAARYGALSGFGLSLAKWTLIVKKSTDLASHESSWLWWLIMSFGCLICVRALVQYVSIKRTWRMMSASAQERLLFFY